MRKYILTDRNGATTTGQKLQPGKYLQTESDKFSLMRNLDGCGGDSPLLAALISPIPANQARLFLINCWKVDTNSGQSQSYTVIKETGDIPQVSSGLRLRFAVLVAKESCEDREFQRWADGWLMGGDQSAAKVQALLHSMDSGMQTVTELETKGTRGTTGSGKSSTDRRDRGRQRALHVLRAVHLSGQADRTASAAMEIARALTRLDQLREGINTAALAEIACSLETAEASAIG